MKVLVNSQNRREAQKRRRGKGHEIDQNKTLEERKENLPKHSPWKILLPIGLFIFSLLVISYCLASYLTPLDQSTVKTEPYLEASLDDVVSSDSNIIINLPEENYRSNSLSALGFWPLTQSFLPR